MGAAPSVESRHGTVHEDESIGHQTDTARGAARKRNVIFSEHGDNYESDMTHLMQNRTDGQSMTPETTAMISTALNNFFFFQSKDESEQMTNRMQLILNNMHLEEHEEGQTIITEGEAGAKLYVVESGELDVTINGTHIRTMTKGAIIGELALLYDAPRSATVMCQTKCTLWTLGRDIFKKIQTAYANVIQIQRAKWCVASPDLKTLQALDLSRLVANLQDVKFKKGDVIIQEGVPIDHIYIIEVGHAEIASTTLSAEENPAAIDDKLRIVRPKVGKRKSVQDMNFNELAKFMNASDFETAEDAPGKASVRKTTAHTLCEVYEGCIVGIAALKSQAGLLTKEEGWEWKTIGGKTGAVPSFTMTAKEDMAILTFTVQQFENLFGPVSKVLNPGSPKANQNAAAGVKVELTFEASRFKQMGVLGSGSFGIVTLAVYNPKAGENQEIKGEYALKSLIKQAVVETGQDRHVLDERQILATMSSRFILKLFGTYQTPHTLVMVTEVVHGGDLWAVIYESDFYEKRGIPYKLVAFYASCLILGLHDIHAKGVVFRDLKPENVMLNSMGYLKIIDFGFAKRVPFMQKDSNGVTKVFSKSYTLCGTPEYLSPELIFNLGHNHAADVWALGVMIYEMLMTVTPFSPKRPDNITELFTNIAMVKKNGLTLSSKMNTHAGTPHATGIVGLLLKADPSERSGIQECSTKAILEHPFFACIDIAKVEAGQHVPEYVPETKKKKLEPLSSVPAVRPYKGDQSVFVGF